MAFSGEFGFIDMIRDRFGEIGEQDIVGIGDDCAVMPLSATEALVITTDMLNEEVHFLREATSARELGAKSLAVNLSDIAAMGAQPVASFLSIALPKACRGAWAEEFMDGYREISAKYGVRLAGGDTTASKTGVIVNVSVIGRVRNGHIKYRGDARPGDIIAVNGMLGESKAGLNDILEDHLDTAQASAHRNPVPQVAEGIWLGGRREVHAMIDLSDGMASDLQHILNASNVRAEVDIASIPTLYPIEWAVEGGEDYKLLFTVSPKSFGRLREDYGRHFGTEIYPVGMIAEGSPEIVWMNEGRPVDMQWRGFEHF